MELLLKKNSSKSSQPHFSSPSLLLLPVSLLLIQLYSLMIFGRLLEDVTDSDQILIVVYVRVIIN